MSVELVNHLVIGFVKSPRSPAENVEFFCVGRHLFACNM